MDVILSALRAAGEPTRLRILGLLGHGELTVTELTQILRQSQPRVSRHLRLLSEAGLLDRFREGAWVFYRIVESGPQAYLARTIVDLLPEDDMEHQRDLERLGDVREARAEAAAAYFRANAPHWDKIRSLYVPEEQVEKRILSVLDDVQVNDLLDIGTGTGRILEVFSRHIKRGLGIDLSPEMLTVARASLAAKDLAHCQVRLGDMYDIPLANESMDLVILHQVLHFAEDAALALKEAARVLRPDGVALIVDFAPHDNEDLRDDHQHRRLGFADEEVSLWARAAGLGTTAIEHLDGGELTVTLWRLRKTAAGQQPKSLELVS
ncbi:ArsR family transcriptional regulator [Iodidimonas gelatinilytica]|uniref:ArsR family transcriptional regulator n=1 Tax=Iodidimonas gelatinilytica TaxID=1236966 RepID=A0A5A7MXW7_9PROT|nr:metalloregulator ArsR/SmtB family transcription factor [Iodidimonas gelatinilytica]GEQ98686.1 ArsR family transcriptional regulator [Iodidimonas gelatinilytica]GER00832.1 ArsR family transcriptional regulator [Iodidimonas gelatinilytica]